MIEMKKHRKEMAEKFLSHALGIIYLLTGEEYTIVKKKSPHSSIYQLTGEVPIKCDDVAVYFSMKEWEYIEEHKELYMDVMMDDHQTVSCPGNKISGCCDENLKPISVSEEEENGGRGEEVPQVETHSDLAAEHVERTPPNNSLSECEVEPYIRVLIKEENPMNFSTGRLSGPHLSNPIAKHLQNEDVNVTKQEHGENQINTDVPPKNPSTPRNTEEDLQPIKQGPLGEPNISINGENETTEYAASYFKSCSGESSLEPQLFKDCLFQNEIKSGFSQFITFPGTNATSKPFVCPDCGKCFSEKNVLIAHQKVHIEKPFACSECGKRFAVETRLVIHQKYHARERPFACSDCGKCFSLKTQLVTHQKIHSGIKPFVCSDCGKSFTEKGSLVRHHAVHTGEKPFACSVCGKCFYMKSHLVTHQRIHTGVKPFVCSDCGKSFIEKGSLIRHHGVHTGEKPYACPDCGRCFRLNCNLVRHQKLHKEEKPFACSDCGKSFIQTSDLIKHQRVHTGEKPFACPDCGRCFGRSTGLSRHRKLHSGNKLLH